MQAAALQQALAQVVGAAHALPAEAAHCTDWTGSVRGAAAVAVAPADAAQVAQVLALAHAHAVPVTIQGGNTGMSGGGVPLAGGAAGGIVLCLRRLRRIRSVQAAARTLTAEAGCTLAQVQAAAADAGLFFPLALGAQGSCQIGGNLATNAGGLNVLRYGSVRAWCLGVEAVLADGRIYHGLSALHKDNSGYDLRDLLIGSEGTLAVITAATLKLTTPPQVRLTAWAGLPSLPAALRLLQRLQEASGGEVTAFEVISAETLHLLRRLAPAALPPFAQLPPWAVLLEVAGGEAAALHAALAQEAAGEALVAASEGQRAAFWRLREDMPLHLARHGKWHRTDIALPRLALAAFVDELRARLQAVCDGVYLIYGHLGDGNLHVNFRPRDEAPQDNPALTQQMAAAIYECVAAHGGSFSAEHGIGQLKTGLMRQYKDETALAMMRAIKSGLDEKGILNPGKVLG